MVSLRQQSSGSYTPYSPRNATTPRSQGIRRLESTRDVRHGSVVIERNEALISMDPSKDPRRKVHEEGLYLNLTTRSNDTITVEWTYCPALCKYYMDYVNSGITTWISIYVKFPVLSRRRFLIINNKAQYVPFHSNPRQNYKRNMNVQTRG